MSDQLDKVAAQLSTELGAAAWNLGSLVSPNEALDWSRRMTDAAGNMALSICSDNDDEAAQAVIDVLNVLWPHGAPEDHDPAWWRTPLGQACARSLGHTDAEAVTHSVAAAMLGTSKGSVSGMVAYGSLDRHPDGGVLRASVLMRIAGTP